MKKLTKGEVTYLSGVVANLLDMADRLDPLRSHAHREANILTSVSMQLKQIIRPYIYGKEGKV